jgi:sugar phosphate isomerase/epimerase
LGNTFEAYPDYLVRVVEEVGRQNFKLAFDLGHFLVYAEIDLPAWLAQIAPFCSTVYLHSNDGKVDTHAEPFQGILRPDQVALMKRYLPEKTRLVAKPFNKSAIPKSVAWIEAALNQEIIA